MALSDSSSGTCHVVAARNGSGTSRLRIVNRYRRDNADRRAQNAGSTTSTARTAIAGPNDELSDRCSPTASNRSESASNVTTCPHACTPVSVRPAPTRDTSARNARSMAAFSAPATVACPGCMANP